VTNPKQVQGLLGKMMLLPGILALLNR